MSLKTRILALTLSVMMLLSPVAASAQSAFSAGDLTVVTVGEAYAAGEQINVTVNFGLDVEEPLQSKRMNAAASLLSKSTLHMSFYDDFGTARIHAVLDVDGMELVTANVLVYEDGSVQMMTNLTGSYVLALPAGTFVDGVLNLNFGGEEAVNIGMEDPEFMNLPAQDRLRISSEFLMTDLLSMLLGWVSSTQMKTGELYTFDDTYIEATDDRDAVSQRMVGKILTGDFIGFLWAVAASLKDEHPYFTFALADVLAENGVSRYDLYQLADTLFSEQTVDPAIDFVQPPTYIYDDGTPCTERAVQYFLVKLHKCIDALWYETTYKYMGMTVSYDDYGEMVGFDAEVPQICYSLPYEGFFRYSVKTDDNWQRRHTAHGELQVYNNQRIVGDLAMQKGEDVGGVSESYLTGALDILNQDANTSFGFGVDAGLTFTIEDPVDGVESELFEGGAMVTMRENGEDVSGMAAGVTLSGMTTRTDDTFAIDATAAFGMEGAAMIVAQVKVEQVPYEDIVFSGGQAIDLSVMTEEQMGLLTKEVTGSVSGMAMSFMAHPSVLSDMMTLISD